MKYFIIILALLVGGCHHHHTEGIDYIGVLPAYASTTPHVWQPPFEGAERQLKCHCCPPTDWTKVALPK